MSGVAGMIVLEVTFQRYILLCSSSGLADRPRTPLFPFVIVLNAHPFSFGCNSI